MSYISFSKLIPSCLSIILYFSCSADASKKTTVTIEKNKIHNQDSVAKKKSALTQKVDEIFAENSIFIANSFDYPVGKPNAKGYYNAQAFGKNYHLGDDWNAVTGGNSDLGDPIYAIANGYVHCAQNYYSGWGNIIRIWHKKENGQIIEAFDAHGLEMLVNQGTFVKKGDKTATIGNADGAYLAHLHFEIRNDITLPIGPGYSVNTAGYLDPTKFIKANR